jgi:hypothetical protein
MIIHFIGHDVVMILGDVTLVLTRDDFEIALMRGKAWRQAEEIYDVRAN